MDFLCAVWFDLVPNALRSMAAWTIRYVADRIDPDPGVP